MWQWEAANCVTDKEFEELLGIIKNILPEGNDLPHTMYEAKKKLFSLFSWTYTRFMHALMTVSSMAVNMRNLMPVLFVTQVV